jgi:hypothetical protein
MASQISVERESSTILKSLDKFYEHIVEPGFNLFGIGVKAHPFRRFLVVSSVTGFALWVYKPQSLFKDDGSARPWSLNPLNIDGGVPINWIGLSLLLGTMSILFV